MLCVAVAALALLRPGPQHLRRLGTTVASPAIAALPLAASADEAPWDTFIASSEARELGVFFAQTLISWGVPAVVLLFTILLASGPGPDGDGADSLPPALAKALGVSKEPKEFLKVQRLNSKLRSFEYSLAKASVSKDAAMRSNERSVLERRFGAVVASMGLSSEVVSKISEAAEKYRKLDGALRTQQETKLRELRMSQLKTGGEDGKSEAKLEKVEEGEEMGVGAASNASSGVLSTIRSAFASSRLQSDVSKLAAKRLELEADFLTSVGAAVSPDQVRQAWC